MKTKVKGMSKNAVKALMSVPDVTNKTGRRDLALIILLYATACRIDEVLSLKNKQLYLDAEKPYITIIGKGTKIRTIGLLPKAVAHLKGDEECSINEADEPQSSDDSQGSTNAAETEDDSPIDGEDNP